MPIYDYVCGSCGQVVEVIHSISAPGPTTCERCGGTLKRALSAPAIVFKGSGWAKKDARDAGRARAAPAANADTAATGDAPDSSKATPDSSNATPDSSKGTPADPSAGAREGGGDTASTTTATTTTSGGSAAAPS